MDYLYFLGTLALLLLIWAVCRTPASERDAETQRATQLADKSRPQALFGPHHHQENGHHGDEQAE